MPIACRIKRERGKQFCVTSCPAVAPESPFEAVRVERAQDLPPAEARILDIAVLDMNFGWPNLGHDSLVHAVLDSLCDLTDVLSDVRMGVRILSFDVRRRRMIPVPPGERFTLYLGTGGPGHLDPRGNDGTSEGSQGISEDPSWEEPLFRLFDAILADPDAALLGVCHSFGVLCRWSGAARAVLRPPEKGGKSAGILENLLTTEAQTHPWFSRFARLLPEGRRLRVVDHRLFDMIPEPGPRPEGLRPIAYETRGIGGPAGDALTMMEFARDREGVMPRIFGVNHHPEIVDRTRQLMILRKKLDRGEVGPEWFEERAMVLTQTYPDDAKDQRLHLASDFTLLAPLRFHLHRQVRRRAESLGLRVDIHEEQILSDFELGSGAQDVAMALSSRPSPG